jgi:hypothetical protein
MPSCLGRSDEFRRGTWFVAGAAGLLTGLLLAAPTYGQAAKTREQKVREDKARVEAEGFWIYNDLPRAFAEATRSGRPILVVLRCLPCENCVKLDDDLIDKDPRLVPLMEQFVRVRVVSANGLDLSLFQFDTDQSFAVFMLRHDGTIYGRYGTRSDQVHWANDVSIEGLAQALEGALTLHRDFPKYRAALLAKRGPQPDFPVPESFPQLKGRYGPTLDYDGNVVRSCIHCHQIGDAQRAFHRQQPGNIPLKLLFPYPHPKAIGLVLDPTRRARVLKVEPDSPAAQAGFLPGDDILTLADQPLLSIADVQWVLHHTPERGGSLAAKVQRGDHTVTLRLTLADGWRQKDDISWRASSWQLRQMALGGMLTKPLTADEREALKLPADRMALKVQHVGQYPPHDRAKKAGVRVGDILISYDGRTDLVRETDLLAYALRQVPVGSAAKAVFLRDGQRITLDLPTSQ